MGLLNLTPPTIGQPNATEDTDIVNAFNTIQTWANGNVDETNMPTATLQRLGLNGSGTVGQGKSIIATTEARTGTVTAYDFMPTPDRVQNIVLPTDGLIFVLYQAYWNESVDGAALAAIFVGANQLKTSQVNTAAPAVQETLCAGAANITQPLSTFPGGLNGYGGTSLATGHAAPVTTGQVVTVQNSGQTDTAGTNFGGGPCCIFAAAGTYDIGIKFKASSGAVNVLNRKLWVWSRAF